MERIVEITIETIDPMGLGQLRINDNGCTRYNGRCWPTSNCDAASLVSVGNVPVALLGCSLDEDGGGRHHVIEIVGGELLRALRGSLNSGNVALPCALDDNGDYVETLFGALCNYADACWEQIEHDEVFRDDIKSAVACSWYNPDDDGVTDDLDFSPYWWAADNDEY